MPREPLNVAEAVRERYSAGAQTREAELCCAVSYDPALLEVIPQDVIDRDYGCGDPSPFVRPGDVVLDLGSGTGKICYIAAQITGAEGRVIGVDVNREMLELAQKHAGPIAERLGYGNVSFVRGRIQDLALDLEQLDAWIAANPLRDSDDLVRVEAQAARLRQEQPLIADASVDIVLSNCVLNLVDNSDKRQLFDDIFRVLKPGGRAAISDIVSDEAVPQALREDAELWSGCLSGAYQELDFIKAFERVGFEHIDIVKRDDAPWRTVDGIAFRSLTLLATKGLGGECLEQGHAVIYRGPFLCATDDDGHMYRRGERTEVCNRTFRMLRSSSLSKQFYFIDPSGSSHQGLDLTVRGAHNDNGCCSTDGCC